jgi:non-specific serine/threonine protein kinase
MIRRLPGDIVVRKPDDDNELLRIVASAANEVVDALGRPAAKVAAALNQVIGRYSRTLRLTTRNVHEAIEDAKEALQSDGMRAAFRPAGEPDERVEAPGDDEAPLGPATAAPDPTLEREQGG